MRVAFLASRFPYPPLKGDKIRSYYPIKLLSRNHEIDLFSFSDEPITPAHLAHMDRYCRRVEVVPIAKGRAMLRMAASVFMPWPSQVAYYGSRRMSRLLAESVSSDGYDLVHVVCGRLAAYAKRLRDVPKTIDWIDALSLSTQRRTKTERNPMARALCHLEFLKMQRFEMDSIRRFDYSVITSRVDQAFLGDRIDEVLPNGVDTDQFCPMPGPRDVDLIFTGNLAYEPNVVAVEFFCKDVLPRIRARRPGTRFFAVGTTPSTRVRRLDDGSAVTVTGFVESVAEMLNRSRVFVAPMQSGAGIQNKVLEAMACGVPVVSTTLGNAGIQARQGSELVIADSPSDFAASVVALLEAPGRATTLGAAGRALVVREFSWETKVARLDEIFGQVACRARVAPFARVAVRVPN